MSDSVRPHPWDSPGKNTGVGCHFLLQCVKVRSESEVPQSCPTPRSPMDCSPPGSSVHGISQARVLEWGAIAFSSCFEETLLNFISFHETDKGNLQASYPRENYITLENWEIIMIFINDGPCKIFEYTNESFYTWNFISTMKIKNI